MGSDLRPEIIHQSLAGDRRCQRQLYEYCFPVLMRICVRFYINRDDARAMVNLGFLKVIQNAGSLKDIKMFDAWLSRLMTNAIIDEKRSKHAYNKTVILKTHDDDCDDAYGGIDWNSAHQKLDAESILALVRQLPPAENMVFNLYAIDGYTHKEISEYLNIPVGTSKWLLSEARKKMITELTKLNECKHRVS